MKIIHKDRTKTFKTGESCTATEYPLEDGDINGAVIELTGRYPDTGMVMNLKCKELVFVMKGSGRVVVDDGEIRCGEGDTILIEPYEKYFWEGTITLFISSAPAWYPEQHKRI